MTEFLGELSKKKKKVQKIRLPFQKSSHMWALKMIQEIKLNNK